MNTVGTVSHSFQPNACCDAFGGGLTWVRGIKMGIHEDFDMKRFMAFLSCVVMSILISGCQKDVPSFEGVGLLMA